MADNILKLRVESSEYDAKLKIAAEGIRHLAEVAHRGAGELTGLDQAELDYVRSLGEMETKSRTAAGSVRELESAYKELKVIYDKLNDVEKNDEAGKAIAASLDSIKGRAQEARAQLESASRSLQDNGQTAQQTGGIIGELSSKLGISITKLAGWGAAIAAAKGALDVAKDAFFASEQNIDSWGQAVEAGQAVYESFLTSINSGDISGYLSRIGQITNAAIEAYNALDQLNTQKTIQSPQVAVKQAEISRMRTMLQTGRYVAPADGRSTGGMKTGDVLTKEQLSNISKNLEQALNEVATITRSQVKTASTAIDKLYAEQAAVLGVSKQRFQQATSSWQNFQDAMGKANAYEKWRTENTTYTSQTTSTGAVIRTANYDDSKNPYRDWAWVSRFKDDGERFQRLIQEIQNRESAKATLYSQYGQAYRRINRAEGVNPYGNIGDGSDAKKTNTELKQNESAISKLTEQYQKLATEAKTASDAQKVGITTRMEAIQGEIKLLIQRNDELKRFAAEAQGMKVSVGISSSLPELTKQLKQLQDAQGQAINNADWTSYAKQIELVQYQINAIKGQWKEGLQATFSFKADIPNVKTVTFKADDSDVLEKAREINGVKINDKTLTVTALTEDAEVALRNLDGMNPVPKFLSVMANTAEAEESLRRMGAEQIGDKTFRVTAEMADTLTQLQDVNAYTINDKTFAVDANTQEVLDKLKGVQDIVIDPKTLTVTALTLEAYNKVQELFANIEGTTVTFNVEPKQTEMSTGMSITTQGGMNSYISQLKSDLAKADFGSDIYKSIAAKLTDMTSLSNLVTESLKAGLGTALFDAADILGEDFWTRAMEGGVEDIDWQGIVDKINEKLQEMDLKPISLDFDTGNVDGGKDGKDNEQKGSNANGLKQIVGNISTITGALQQLGVDVPEGFQKTLGVMQVITTILMALQSISTITATSSALKSIPIIGMFLHNGGVVHAANGFTGTVPGDRFSGDQIPALLDSGETVLNRAQAGNMVSQLETARNSNIISGETRVEADEMVLLLRNGAARKGVTIGDYLGL